MRIELYHLERHLSIHNFVTYPILDTLRIWTEEAGHRMRVQYGKASQVDLDTDAEVIAFHVYTYMAWAAYELADMLRAKGKIVILGGPHFQSRRTLDEASMHAHVVVQTICREQWGELLEQIQDGKLCATSAETVHIVDSEKRFSFPDNLYQAYEAHPRYKIPMLMSTLGCPYSCDFCNPFRLGKLIARDLDLLHREAKSARNTHVGFCDATFGLNRAHAVALLRRLAPLRKRMFIETTLSLLDDDELLDAMAVGGVRWIAVGVESLSIPQKKHGGRSAASPAAEINRVISKIADRGMLVQTNFICGLDCDGLDSFDRIFEFYVASRAAAVYVDIMVPYPNSRLFQRLEAEGRILDHNWAHYDYRHLVYKPRKMSEQQLVDRFNQLYNALTDSTLLFKKAAEILDIVGPAGWPMVAWNVSNKLDAWNKRASLNQSLKSLA